MTDKKQKGTTLDVQRVHLSSRPNKIAMLNVGETYSEAVRINISDIDSDEFNKKFESLCNGIARARVFAEERTGFKYEQDSGTMVCRKGALLMTSAVTRIE